MQIKTKKNKELGITQSKLKFAEINNKKSIFDYRYKESVNSYSEYNSLVDIYNNLDNFELNKSKILQRLNILKTIFKFETSITRIAPVILIDTLYLKNIRKLEKIFIFMHKIINFKNNRAKKFLLFPLHFMIKDKVFSLFLKTLKANYNKV